MGGEGTGDGGQAQFGPDEQGTQPETIKGKLDPKGRITVTTFRGLPRPGQVTTEMREVIREAREEAQAPLEGEEIPRRYREGIRAYFDGLGETPRDPPTGK